MASFLIRWKAVAVHRTKVKKSASWWYVPRVMERNWRILNFINLIILNNAPMKGLYNIVCHVIHVLCCLLSRSPNHTLHTLASLSHVVNWHLGQDCCIEQLLHDTSKWHPFMCIVKTHIKQSSNHTKEGWRAVQMTQSRFSLLLSW